MSILSLFGKEAMPVRNNRAGTTQHDYDIISTVRHTTLTKLYSINKTNVYLPRTNYLY